MANIKPEIQIPPCSSCGSGLIERTTKNGRKIWACPNWKYDGTGCQGDIYDPNRNNDHQKKYPRVMIRWNVPSRSEKGKNRTVEFYEDGNSRCNCPAWKTFCYHQQMAITQLEELFKKIKKY